MIDIGTLIFVLRENLNKATPGEWEAEGPTHSMIVWAGPELRVCFMTSDGPCEANARHVALASPQNIRALLDHIERLKYDLDLAKEQSLLNYNDATGLAMKLGTAEAELARLRKPVTEGEVKGVVRSLSLIACAPRCEHASECNCTVLDNAADLIQRLAGQVAEAQQDRCVPTCHEIADKAFAARDAAEARLREAVEVIALFRERIEARGEWDDGCFYHNRTSASELQEPLTRARAFLSTLEDHSNGS